MGNNAFVFDDVCVPPECQIGMNSHSCLELSYIICGEGIRTIGNHTEPFSQGEIILIAPNIPHVWQFNPAITDSQGNIANISVFFQPQLIVSMKDLFPEMAEQLEKIEMLEHAVSYTGETREQISNLLVSMRGLSADKRLSRMIDLLMMISDTSESRFAGKNNMLSKTEQRLENIRIYCTCNYARQITLDELSRHIGMSRSSLCTFMRRHTGMTLSEYINDMRLCKAKEKLIQSDSGIAEIAFSCGFQNVTYFNRLFRAKYGHSPKAVRCKV